MSIKSDKWIKRQCIVPTHMTILRKYAKPNPLEPFLKLEEITAPSWETRDNLIATPVSHHAAVEGLVAFRELHADEKAMFEAKQMIAPFVPNQVRVRTVDLTVGHSNERSFDGPRTKEEKIISYGTSSFGYDVRLANKFKIFTNVKSAMIDPLNMSDDCYVDHEGEFCIIPPNSYILGHTVERFVIPRDVMVVCLGKSTYARCGAIVNVTPIEAGFEGTVVIEISNSTPLPLKVYAGQGIAQFMFFQSDEECEVSYADRGGKYQGQNGLRTALV